MYLARRIARAKWDKTRNLQRGLADDEISADAVTGDLRTRDNSLSFWRVRTQADGEIEDVALAIAAAGERLDRLDMVWIAEKELQADGQVLEESTGRTPITDLADRHIDICRLDYSRLGKVARRVAAAIEGDQCCILPKGRVKKLLVEAIKAGRVTPEKLADRLRSEIG